VPLRGDRDALGVIARGCRSRLFGYFFSIPGGSAPSHEQLKTLSAAQAVALALFSGEGLEDLRWEIVATSVAFDREAWPFPQFAARGAFGRTWTRVTYDPLEMRIASREPIDEKDALGLPDARLAGADDLESLLDLYIGGQPAQTPQAVYEVRPPVDAARLRLLEHGGRLALRDDLPERDLHAIAAFVDAHPAVELRVHGFAQRLFDASILARFPRLRALVLDVPAAVGLTALRDLRELQLLRVGATREPAALDALCELHALHALELHGAYADLATATSLHHLRSLKLVSTPAPRFDAMASAPQLRSLAIAHGEFDAHSLAGLPSLEHLEIADMALASLPDLSQNRALRSLVLRNVRNLRDLKPLASLPALRDLRVSGMPQLEVADFAPLQALPLLRKAGVEIGSRRKSREVYRMLRVGTITP